MQKYVEKAEILIEALPYIKDFNGKTVVIKYGGSAMIDPKVKKTIMQDIALMKLVGMNPVIVHGGGPAINNYLNKMNKKSEFIDGLRVTDAETMEIVEMTLSGKLSKQIATQLQLQGVNAASLSGRDGGLLTASKHLQNGKDLGFVGKIEKVNPCIINALIAEGFIPVISPIGADEKGQSYNINADYAAVSIAASLQAEKLVFLTDVEGLLLDISDPSTKLPRITVPETKKLIQDGTVSGGMIPKINCCVEAVEAGVKNVHMLDGRVEHCLLLEIFTKNGIGTLIEN